MKGVINGEQKSKQWRGGKSSRRIREEQLFTAEGKAAEPIKPTAALYRTTERNESLPHFYKSLAKLRIV